MVFVVLLLIVLAVLGLVLYRRRGGAEARAHRKRERELGKELATVTKRHTVAIKAAQKDVKSAQSAYDKRTQAVARELTELRNPDGRRLAAYRGFTLHELAISTPQGKGDLIGTTASVDSAGNMSVTRRGTLTRTVAGGVLLGPVGAVIGGAGMKKAVKHDDRELYLTVETPTVAAVVQCPAEQGMKARQFAAQINTAAKQAPAIAESRPGQIADAESRLAVAKADTAALNAAESKLAQVTADPVMRAAIEAAQQSVAAHAQTALIRKELPAAS